MNASGRFSLIALSLLTCLPAVHVRANPEAPVIPEPLVFDMMRPMGAAKGELEVNTLAIAPLGRPRPRTLEYAPEIEYAFADGYAIEFELPFEGSRLAEYKLGLQGTIGTGFNNQFIHGWQYLGIYDREERKGSHSLLYMAGYRFDSRWSVMNMAGVEHTDTHDGSHLHGLLNHSVFYDYSERTVLGVEANLRLGREDEWLLIPQMHFRFTDDTNIQFGAGLRNGMEDDKARPIVSARLIYEF